MIKRTYQYDTPDGTETVTIESLTAIDHSCTVMEFERLHNCTLTEIETV